MTSVTLEDCIYLGGAGYPVAAGAACHVALSPTHVLVSSSAEGAFTIPLVEVCEIEVSGPGTVSSGGGFSGGGFGVESALQGIAVAVVLNAVTTRSKIHTFISIHTNVGELHFHYAGMEPSALRISIASTLSAIRRQSPDWQRTRLAILEFERDHRGLSAEEFERLKLRMYKPQQQSRLEPLQVPLPEQGSLGSCPNCRSTLLLDALECKKCKAQFGSASAWRVVPI